MQRVSVSLPLVGDCGELQTDDEHWPGEGSGTCRLSSQDSIIPAIMSVCER